MALTDVEICANALVRLGAQPIQSFSDGTDVATFCETIYNQKKKYLLSSYPWRFSMKYLQLSRDSAAPTAQWSYQYTMPADRIQSGMPAVYTSSDVGAGSIRSFEIIGNKLMTDETEIWVQYQYDVDESLWPEYFTELMIMVMKVELAQLVTDNTQLYQETKLEVYGTPSEGGFGGLVNITRNLDSRDNPTIYITDFTLVNARFGGVYQ
jgi:hypothetical protein